MSSIKIERTVSYKVNGKPMSLKEVEKLISWLVFTDWCQEWPDKESVEPLLVRYDSFKNVSMMEHLEAVKSSQTWTRNKTCTCGKPKVTTASICEDCRQEAEAYDR